MDQLRFVEHVTKEWICWERSASSNKGTDHVKGALEHPVEAWSTWKRFPALAMDMEKQRVLVVPFGTRLGQEGCSCTMTLPLVPSCSPLAPWCFLLCHAWPFCAMHVPIVPLWCFCSKLDALAPFISMLHHLGLLLHHHRPSWHVMRHIDSLVVPCWSKFSKKMMMLKNVPEDATWRIRIGCLHSWAYGPIGLAH